ncbi:MAG: GNAT family N-acetyltransferase [Bryobacteraceae bacterium]|nr:GNAT family N-acetyltransferase [Bryobacteraceae bacterium]MDW8379939.1 GNAT family N-acetyltransferase [Bryobacterales bacterium]
MAAIEIVRAGPEHAALLLQFIRSLAQYEKLSDQVVATEESLKEAMFGGRSVAEALIAYYDGQPAGMALYFHNFSTFLAKPGLYLEDLFVEPQYRGRGIGKALLAEVAAIAVERNCGRLDWAVLHWNEPAIRFYENLGATALRDWVLFRLSGEALTRLAQSRTARC